MSGINWWAFFISKSHFFLGTNINLLIFLIFQFFFWKSLVFVIIWIPFLLQVIEFLLYFSTLLSQKDWIILFSLKFMFVIIILVLRRWIIRKIITFLLFWVVIHTLFYVRISFWLLINVAIRLSTLHKAIFLFYLVNFFQILLNCRLNDINHLNWRL